MIVYTCASDYIESKTDLLGKIQAIDAIIASLESTALKMAANDNISEYNLNDGQTIIKTVYRGAEAVGKSIDQFERIRQRYLNRLDGRHQRLVDSKNFIRRFYTNFYGR